MNATTAPTTETEIEFVAKVREQREQLRLKSAAVKAGKFGNAAYHRDNASRAAWSARDLACLLPNRRVDELTKLAMAPA